MRHIPTHPFHLVDISPWPILMSFSMLSGALALVNWITLGTTNSKKNLIIFINLVLILVLWFKDVIREGLGGYHTNPVKYGILLGFLLFLVTEVLLFVSLFWAYFHSSLNPSVELAIWPPLGVNAVNYLSLPLLNSVLLLSGGFLCTWGHHAFLIGRKTSALIGLIGGIVLTIIFVYIQYIEYSYAEFTFSDSVYGSVFFILTGTHGIHVICAVLFLLVATWRVYSDSVTSEHALNLDFALIYYHLVDVVWLVLFIIVYYWGS